MVLVVDSGKVTGRELCTECTGLALVTSISIKSSCLCVLLVSSGLISVISV